MNLALNYCWKEWRAQRGRLLAYTLLAFTCLCIGVSLMPSDWWLESGFGTHALTWFVAAGILGVVAFVVPSLVRSEFTSNDDQFVCRLPNALLSAFAGKSLFLVLVAISLPLLGLVVGELFLLALGYEWDSILLWQWDGQIFRNVPSTIFLCGAAVLLLPWIWAVGTWLPGGRLALLGTVLLGLLIERASKLQLQHLGCIRQFQVREHALLMCRDPLHYVFQMASNQGLDDGRCNPSLIAQYEYLYHQSCQLARSAS